MDVWSFRETGGLSLLEIEKQVLVIGAPLYAAGETKSEQRIWPPVRSA